MQAVAHHVASVHLTMMNSREKKRGCMENRSNERPGQPPPQRKLRDSRGEGSPKKTSSVHSLWRRRLWSSRGGQAAKGDAQAGKAVVACYVEA